MTNISQLILYTLSAKQTHDLGRTLGSLLSPGQIIALSGDLGAGKTCLVQGIAKGLKVKDEYITSPTFTILNEYEGIMPVYHFDVYRLSGPAELEELGYEEYFYGTGVTIIEWAEKIAMLLPNEHLQILLEYQGEEVRKLSFLAQGAKTMSMLRCFRDKVFF